MNPRRRIFAVTLCVFLYTSAFSATPFHWQWRKMEDDNFWQHPIVRQIRDTNLRQSITEAIQASLGVRAGTSDVELWDIAANESYEWVDLDGDGVPELITGGYGINQCGATGNCSLQVFRRRGSKFGLILSSREQGIMVDHSGSKPLLVLYTHGSAFDGELKVYSFPRNANAQMMYDYHVTWGGIDGKQFAEPRLE